MEYTKDQIEKGFKIIINLIEKGSSLRGALKVDGTCSHDTFYKWLEIIPTGKEQYAHAKTKRAEVIFEEILTIADNQEADVYKNEDGVEVTNHNVINRARLRIDSRKWMLGKMMPARYSDKIELNANVTGIGKITVKGKKPKTKKKPSTGPR